MRRNFRALVWLCAVILPTVSAHAATRVALVSTCGGDTGQDVLALAESALSAQKHLVLVERREVEHILNEQKLVRCGLSDSEQALAVGKLLGVEIFAAVETFPGSRDTLALVAFDALTGARLWDAALPSGTIEKTAREVGAAVSAACEKRSRAKSGLRTICLLGIRNADLPREMDGFCRAVGQLLERRLLSSPGLLVLERHRLEHLNRERQLPTIQSIEELLPSLTLLELEFAKESGGAGIHVTALFSSPSGESVGTASGKTDGKDAATTAESLVTEVIRALRAAPAGQPADRGREAERFRQEAKFLIGHSDFARGLQAAEAFLALRPEDKEYRLVLADYLVGGAKDLLQPGRGDARAGHLKVNTEDLRRSLTLARRAVEIDRQVRDEKMQRGSLHIAPGADHVFRLESALTYYLENALSVVEGHDDETRKLLETFQREFRDLLMGVEDRAYHAIHDDETFQTYSKWVSLFLTRNLEYLSPTSAEWTSDSIAVLSRWMKTAEMHRQVWSAEMPVNRMLARPSTRTAQMDWLPNQRHGQWTLDARDYARWEAFFHQMEQHSQAVVQLYGAVGLIWTGLNTSALSSNETIAAVQTVVEQAKQKINAATGPSADAQRLLCYRAALDALGLLPVTKAGAEARRRGQTELLRFMLDRDEIVMFIIAEIAQPWNDAYRQYGEFFPLRFYPRSPAQYGEVLRQIEQVTEALDLPGKRCLDQDHEPARMRLLDLRNQLVKRHPDLATPKPHPWSEARLLFDATQHGLHRIGGVLVNGDLIYVIGMGRQDTKDFFQLVRISFKDDAVKLLGSAPYDCPPYTDPSSIVTGLCLDQSTLYVGTRKEGILAFPTDGGAVKQIGKALGLPSEWVHSLSCLGGKLYAGLGEIGLHRRPAQGSYIIAYDLRSGHCDVLASSLRKQKRSPLDDVSPPYFVPHMRADTTRERLLFTVEMEQDRTRDRLTGLWEIDAPTGRVRQLLSWRERNRWLGPIQDDQLLLDLGISAWDLVSYDLQRDAARILFTRRPRAAGPDLAVDEHTVTTPFKTHPPYALVDGWLWTAQDFGRLSPDGQVQETFSLPDFGQPSPSHYQWACFQLVGNGRQLLAGAKRRLWLLTMPKQ